MATKPKNKLSDPLHTDKVEELYRLWKEPLALADIEKRIEEGNYSPMDMFIFKAYSGEISFLRALFQKVYPDQSDITVDHKSSTMAELLNQLEAQKASHLGTVVEGTIVEPPALPSSPQSLEEYTQHLADAAVSQS